MSVLSLANLRHEFTLGSLLEADVADDPLQQFATWFDQARQAQLPALNAMTLATVGPHGRPSARIMLLKEVDARGFTWFTNYDSRKAHDLQAHPFGALLFHWVALERQVRVEGRVAPVAPSESDAYFDLRPLASRLGAIASDQSRPIADRATLDARYAAVQAREGSNPRRPTHWGGYRLVPDYIEFWQGGGARLHDRIAYTAGPDGRWRRERLQP
jgi:pyridoxamine 5'-phosphate oxidase